MKPLIFSQVKEKRQNTHMENNNNPERAALRPALLPLTFIFHDVEVGGWSAKRAVSRLASSSCVPDFWSVFFFFLYPTCICTTERVQREQRESTKGTWTFIFRRKRKKEQWQWVFWKHSVLESQSRKQHAERRLSLSLSVLFCLFFFFFFSSSSVAASSQKQLKREACCLWWWAYCWCATKSTSP